MGYDKWPRECLGVCASEKPGGWFSGAKQTGAALNGTEAPLLAGRAEGGRLWRAGHRSPGLVPDTRVPVALAELGDPAALPSLSSWARGLGWDSSPGV